MKAKEFLAAKKASSGFTSWSGPLTSWPWTWGSLKFKVRDACPVSEVYQPLFYDIYAL